MGIDKELANKQNDSPNPYGLPWSAFAVVVWGLIIWLIWTM